jgi:diacylglycerol kinase (ATP)
MTRRYAQLLPNIDFVAQASACNLPMKALFLLNPNAGGQGSKRKIELAQKLFADAQWSVDTIRTESVDHMATLIQTAKSNGFDLVILGGGDGTIHKATQFLPLGSVEKPSPIPFAIFPLGSGNDFYRGLHIPSDVWTAADNIINGRPAPTDIGIVEPIHEDGSPRNEPSVRFINTAGVGMDSQTLAIREKAPKFMSARYELLFLATLMKLYPLEVSIKADDWSVDLSAYWILCCNNEYIGSGMHVAPDAKTNDGLMDVLIIPKQSKLSFVMNLPKVFKGTHLSMKGVEIRKAKSLTLHCKPDQRIAVDGDRACSLPVRIRILPGAVNWWMSQK